MSTEPKTAEKAPQVSIVCNGALSVLKLAAGSLCHSAALVSDAVHSAADVMGDLIVLIGVKLSAKYERKAGIFECAAAMVLAAILCVTGLYIGFTALMGLLSEEALPDTAPGLPAVIAAAVSVGVKEILFRYTRSCAMRFDSAAVMAEALHHRTDALASLGTLAGVLGARLGYTRLDAAASLIICVFILKTAGGIIRDAAVKMRE